MNSSDQKCDDFITARVYPILKRSIKRNLCNFKMPTFFYLLLFPLDEMKRKENKHMQVSIDEGKIKLKQNLKISPTSSFNFHSSKLYFN